MSTPIQEVPAVVLPAPFPTTADRVAGVYNAKSKAWADSEPAMATRQHEIAVVTHNNATAAHERAVAAEQSRADAVAQTAVIKNQAVAETGIIRDQAVAARDAAASSVVTAQGLAHFKGKWQDLSGALSVPASVWHAGNYWGLLSNVPDVAAAEPGFSSAWAAVGTQVHRLGYEQRGQLRTLGYPGLQWAMVDGLGMFFFEAGSIEPDDDESCFLTAEGAWLLQCPSMDAVAYWLQPWLHWLQEQIDDNLSAQTAKTDAIPVILRGSAASSITSVATAAQASFTVSVPGAAIGRPAAVSPPNALNARLSIYGRVTAADTVTVYINNPSASAATLTAGTWAVSVL